MPTTHPRTVKIGGLKVEVTLDRVAAERIKGAWGIRTLVKNKQAYPLAGQEPMLNGTKLEDIDWYHTIDLGNGIVTPGFLDHRPQVASYRLPDSLKGLRCLDVATFDGFWALEMEKRGAGEVVGIDVHSRADCDYPRNFEKEYLGWKAPHEPFPVKGMGFAYARRALGSRIQRKVLSVYELSPETVGTFDFVFMSDLLLHLRDPFRAIENVFRVLRPGGRAIIADAYDPALDTDELRLTTRWRLVLDDYSGCHWWLPSPSVLQWMIHSAHFTEIEEVGRLVLPTKFNIPVDKVIFHARRATG